MPLAQQFIGGFVRKQKKLSPEDETIYYLFKIVTTSKQPHHLDVILCKFIVSCKADNNKTHVVLRTGYRLGLLPLKKPTNKLLG